jgi:hypothetical protein
VVLMSCERCGERVDDARAWLYREGDRVERICPGCAWGLYEAPAPPPVYGFRLLEGGRSTRRVKSGRAAR